MPFTDTLTAAAEDYLEAIFQIIAEKQAVRPKDIAKRLKVGNSSVTGALHSLATKELINYAQYDVITLTPAGRAAAEDVIRRHEVLRDFFVNVLAVDAAEADKAACQMEHSVTKVILERFIQLAEFLEACPQSRAEWKEGFGYRCETGARQGGCEKCVAATAENAPLSHPRETSNLSMNLKELKPGQRAKVVKINARGESGKRLLEMGVTPRAILEVERIAPLGDPIEIKVKGYHLSLRKEEAEGIEVELL